jgi:hypothetical protein
VIVDRINSPYFDRYAHFPSCPWSSKHLEQGDFIQEAGHTGDVLPPEPAGIHLHYQKENSSGQSVSGCLSQFCDFSDASYAYDTFISDNAGPGVNSPTPVDLTAWNKIYVAHGNIGHYLCAGEAWDCFGSSTSWLGGPLPFEAQRKCLGYPYCEWGWNQDFYAPHPLSHLNGFDWPEACPSNIAYWVPKNTYVEWVTWDIWAGHPRSSQVWNDYIGGYVQYFRYGIWLSPTFGGDGFFVSQPTTSCYPP